MDDKKLCVGMHRILKLQHFYSHHQIKTVFMIHSGFCIFFSPFFQLFGIIRQFIRTQSIPSTCQLHYDFYPLMFNLNLVGFFLFSSKFTLIWIIRSSDMKYKLNEIFQPNIFFSWIARKFIISTLVDIWQRFMIIKMVVMHVE